MFKFTHLQICNVFNDTVFKFTNLQIWKTEKQQQIGKRKSRKSAHTAYYISLQTKRTKNKVIKKNKERKKLLQTQDTYIVASKD